jgi:hypothetical protein
VSLSPTALPRPQEKARKISSQGISPSKSQPAPPFAALSPASERLSWSSRTLRCFQNQSRYRIIGSAIPLRRSSGLEVFPTLHPSIRRRKISDTHPSVSFASPSESDSEPTAIGLAPAGNSPGVCAPPATSALEARFSRGSQPRHLPTSGFFTLLPVSFFQNLPALFHAGTAHGVLPSGLFPLTEPLLPFGNSDLPDVGLRSDAELQVNPKTNSDRERRLQGFALREDSSPSGMG